MQMCRLMPQILAHSLPLFNIGERLSSLPIREGSFAFITSAELNAVRARRDIASKTPAPPSYPQRDDGF